LSSDGEKPWRDRDGEFVDSFGSRHEVEAHWNRGWECLFTTLASLTDADLIKIVTIRGEAHTVHLAIDRAIAHCGYHVGQIVLTARLLVIDNWKVLTIPRGGSEAFNRHKRETAAKSGGAGNGA